MGQTLLIHRVTELSDSLVESIRSLLEQNEARFQIGQLGAMRQIQLLPHFLGRNPAPVLAEVRIRSSLSANVVEHLSHQLHFVLGLFDLAHDGGKGMHVHGNLQWMVIVEKGMLTGVILAVLF